MVTLIIRGIQHPYGFVREPYCTSVDQPLSQHPSAEDHLPFPLPFQHASAWTSLVAFLYSQPSHSTAATGRLFWTNFVGTWLSTHTTHSKVDPEGKKGFTLFISKHRNISLLVTKYARWSALANSHFHTVQLLISLTTESQRSAHTALNSRQNIWFGKIWKENASFSFPLVFALA